MSQGSLFGQVAMTTSGDSNEFYTPRWFTKPIAEAIGGFDLDPASNPTNTAGAARVCVGERGQDGLAEWWTVDGSGTGPSARVWCNPPYRKPTAAEVAEGQWRDGSPIPPGSAFGDQEAFVRKAALEVSAGRARLVVLLVQLQALGTNYGHDLLDGPCGQTCTSVGLVRGRIAHENDTATSGGTGTFASILLMLGDVDLQRAIVAALQPPVWPAKHKVRWLLLPPGVRS